ncbi:hypothetical protein SDC9_21702 [bioreactor metagenome]|uniref:Uncharacterized protein n=1 Tax=bioreactor metagenome TaxID=1076179 RepID=A0A644UAG9_9ZZZZ|nr:hypothetical protein [Candidatus Elulimicrobiales bacterium]
MNKNIKRNLSELHNEYNLTHKVAALLLFSVLVLLAVYGLSRVKATQDVYFTVPNANKGICYKEGDNFNDPTTHVSCKSYKPVCQTDLGTLVECDTGFIIK